MSALNVLEVMRVGPVIPVIVIDDLAQAVPLAKALVAGGVRVWFTLPAAKNTSVDPSRCIRTPPALHSH